MWRAVSCLLLWVACSDTHERITPDASVNPEAGLPDAMIADAMDAAQMDADPCSSPNLTTVCITGVVRRFVDPFTFAQPTSTSGLVVHAYDAISYLTTGAGTQPLAVSDVMAGGTFVLDSVMRPSSGYVVVVAEDQTGATTTYTPTGTMILVDPSRNANDVVAWFVESTTVDTWQSQIGAIANCNTLRACGMWIGEYIDTLSNPVGHVQPTRLGDDPASNVVDCFRIDRVHLTANDMTDDSGLCMLSPDDVVMHGGACAVGGCTCGGAPCTPTFPAFLGGSVAGSILVHTFRAQ